VDAVQGALVQEVAGRRPALKEVPGRRPWPSTDTLTTGCGPVSVRPSTLCLKNDTDVATVAYYNNFNVHQPISLIFGSDIASEYAVE